MKRCLLAITALVLCAANTSPQEPVPGWTPVHIARLKHWAQAAPKDALPLLDTGQLDAAVRGPDQAAIDRMATALALRLARMHLLGSATPAKQTGWRIVDSDGAIDLQSWLERALSGGSLDPFFEALRPQHPDYAVLRAAFAAEKDPARRLTIARNMERWRWMPQSLGPDYVLVNAANFKASLWRQGQQVGTWMVIVGKTGTPTPVFSATITGVIFNPWWEIPASIVREKRGNFPSRLGYVRANGRYRQRPGPGNALGQMKLVMPNPYSVYMHDTPDKNLFEREVRAFSHGCIRTADALGFAATLLKDVKTREEVDAIVASRRTTQVDLPSTLPVYVAYFTAATDASGALVITPDIYGRDGRISIAGDAHGAHELSAHAVVLVAKDMLDPRPDL